MATSEGGSSIDSRRFSDSELTLRLNDIDHWVRLAGVANQTTPIVVVHGGPGGNNYTFERTIGPMLARSSTIVYYEQRGCGRSRAPGDSTDYERSALVRDLDELRRALGVDKMTLLGWSFGAELALRYAGEHPGSVEQLILSSPAEVSTSVMLVQIQGFYSVAGARLRRYVEEVLARSCSIQEKLLDIWEHAETCEVDRLHFHSENAAETCRRLWEECSLPDEGTARFREVIFATSREDLTEVARGVEVPCLIICGIHDRNGGFHCGKDLAQVLAQSELRLYRKSGHFPDIEESELFAADVATFANASAVLPPPRQGRRRLGSG